MASPYFCMDYAEPGQDVTVTFRGSLDGEHWFAIDDPVGIGGGAMAEKSCKTCGWLAWKHCGSPAWCLDEDQWKPKDKGQEPKKGRSQMNTYKYEVLVKAKRDGTQEQKIVREAQQIAREDDLMVKPTREALLLKYAAKLAEFTGEQAIVDPESEVVVNVPGFCG